VPFTVVTTCGHSTSSAVDQGVGATGRLGLPVRTSGRMATRLVADLIEW
jgi:hypothetical protein